MRVRCDRARDGPYLRREEVPGADAVPTVQPDLDLRAEPLVVLDMKSLLSPLAQGLPQRGLGPFRVVRGEAESRHEESAQVRDHVAVTPFQCLLEDDRPAAAQLGDLSPELERPEREEDCRIDFKGHPGATRAEDVSRPGREARRPASTARSCTPRPPARSRRRPGGRGHRAVPRSRRQFARAWRRGVRLRPPAIET